MSDAPGRIWAWPWNGETRRGQWHTSQINDGVEYIRADLARPKVKPLKWVDAKISSNSPRETAESLVGTYEVLRWAHGEFGGSVPSTNPEASNIEFVGGESLQEAKAAAQEDYERRILAALETLE